jgi:hypothetical protein
MRNRHDHAQLVEGLGGPAAVAKRLGLPGNRAEATVWNWLHRGIPWEWRNAVAELAACDGLGLPENFLRRSVVDNKNQSSPECGFDEGAAGHRRTSRNCEGKSDNDGQSQNKQEMWNCRGAPANQRAPVAGAGEHENVKSGTASRSCVDDARPRVTGNDGGEIPAAGRGPEADEAA